MKTFTIPASAMAGDTGNVEIPAMLRGPFAVHRKFYIGSNGEHTLTDSWQVSHCLTGMSTGVTDGFNKRKHALAYADWLATLPVDWEQDNAGKISADVQAHFANVGMSVIHDKLNEIHAA